VTSSPAGINCGATCSSNYEAGQMVTLTATPDGTSTFAGGLVHARELLLSGDHGCGKSVTATFTRVTYSLSVTRTGAGP